MLYRGMDRAQLDATCNNSAAVENYAAIKLDWSRRIWPSTVPIRDAFMSPVTLPAAT